MEELKERKSILPYSAPHESDSTFDTSYLFGPARGKMFGLLECQKTEGSTIILRAFSGQYNGIWYVESWVPPLFDIAAFDSLTFDIEKEIKRIGRQIDQSTRHSALWLHLRKTRRHRSQKLMRDIHNLYTLNNFRGDTASLSEAYESATGIPTGTGDCCAPKLLNYAATHNLRPLSIIEFYWGKENRSGSRQHGCFYSSCLEKCQPILGFMLCGLDD